MKKEITQTKKLPKLTKKQRGFVNDYVISENGEQSALNNYEIEAKDKGNVARSIASENLTKPNIVSAINIKRKSLKEALIDEGVNEEKIAQKVNDLLEAKKDIYKNNNKTGEIEKVGEEIDYNAIDKGLKHATNIYGIEDINTKPKENVYNFYFEPQFQQNIKNYDENIKSLIRNKLNVQETETTKETLETNE